MSRKQRLALSIRKPARKRVSEHMSCSILLQTNLQIQYVQKSRKCLLRSDLTMTNANRASYG